MREQETRQAQAMQMHNMNSSALHQPPLQAHRERQNLQMTLACFLPFSQFRTLADTLTSAGKMSGVLYGPGRPRSIFGRPLASTAVTASTVDAST